MSLQSCAYSLGEGDREGVKSVHGAGEIGSGSNANFGIKIESHQICEDLRSAAEAEHVQAVVLRIDTPGWCHCPPRISATLIGRCEHAFADVHGVHLCQRNAKCHAVCGSEGLLPCACILIDDDFPLQGD